MIGKTLDGRYRVLSLLGEGGMGRVYLAEHTLLQKRIALKVLHEQYSRSEEVVRRFQQEAIAASRIGQENIVDVTDFGRTADGALYIAMEQLLGVSLAQLIRDTGPVPVNRALPILAQVCKAVGAAHACGIIHRDLKPENVMLVQKEDRPDFVKVLDFGISKVATGDAGPTTRLTRVGMIMGTPEYMAPEQAAGTQIDARADIYAFGVMAYEVLCGELPFVADNPLSILMKHQAEAPPPLGQRRPDLELGEDVERLVMRALEKDPQARQASMPEVLRELAACMDRRGLRPFSMSMPAFARPEVITPGGGVPPPVPLSMLPGDPNRQTRLLDGSAQTQLRARPPDAMNGVRSTLEIPAPPASTEPLPVADPRRSGRMPAILAITAVVLVGGGFAGSRLLRSADAPLAAPSTASVPNEVSPPVAVQEPVAAPAPASADIAEPQPPATDENVSPAVVTLDSVPSGAVVYEGTLRVGITPVELKLQPGTAATYRFALDGFRPATRTVEASERSVKVQLTRIAVPPRKKARPAGSGLKDNPYEDLKANPF